MSYSTFIGDAMMQTLIYTQDRLTKLITLSVVELGYSVKNSVDEAFNTFKCFYFCINCISHIVILL